jgi:uncharacterized protein YecE (DUF72 family)
VTGAAYVGTSGFSYREWKGAFYPERIRPDEMLAFYAARLPSVEINATFRRTPPEEMLRGWADRTPERFRFALKANQRITHRRRLSDPESGTYFVERARALGNRLGPILFQCPPTLSHDRELIEAFVDGLPSGPLYAMEFRHPSWEAARDLLSERGVAWCTSETDEAAVESFAASPFAYLRLRKNVYSDEDLARWAERIVAAVNDDRDVYCYVKHEEGAAGARYAERLAGLVGG